MESKEEVDCLKPEIEKLFFAKEARRRQLAALPFPEKVRVVIQMQRMAAPILRTRGRQVCVWSVPQPES